MLNDKCIGRASGNGPCLALFTFLTSLAPLIFSLYPTVGVAASQTTENLVFVPATLAGDRQSPGYGMTTVDQVYKNLLVSHAQGAYTPDNTANNPVAGTISDYEARVYAIESDAGPFAAELTEVLHSLGNLYLGQGLFDAALASYAREEHINRVNHGLYSETLLPAVKAQIHTLDESGRKIEADDKQKYLIFLLERCYGRDDQRLLPDLINYAEWNMAQFHETIRFEFSEMSALAFGEGMMTEAGYREQAFENLELASRYYTRAINLLVTHNKYGDPMLYQLENRLVELAFFQAARQEMLADPDDYLSELTLKEVIYQNGPYARLTRDAYRYGVESYERQLAYITRDPAGNLARYIDTLMAFGDWSVLFDKYAAGYAKYRQARKLMQEFEVGEPAMADILTPQVPVLLPVFTATPHSLLSVAQHKASLSPYQGYIDVSFRVNRNGHPRAVEVLEYSANTSSAVAKRLKRTVSNSRFRPRFGESDLKRDDRIALRYYYAYQTGPS